VGGKTARRRAASSAGARGCEDAVAPSSAAAHCHGRAAAPARGGCIHRGSGAPAGWPVGSRRTRQLVEKERGGTRRGRAGRAAASARCQALGHYIEQLLIAVACQATATVIIALKCQSLCGVNKGPAARWGHPTS